MAPGFIISIAHDYKMILKSKRTKTKYEKETALRFVLLDFFTCKLDKNRTHFSHPTR